MYSVYKHTCPNGKVYIGIVKPFVERLKALKEAIDNE